MEKEPKILVVEDENYIFIFLRAVLNEMKIHNIVHVKNGLEAVKYCHKNSDISLVLMDIIMPVMDGYEATRKIKQIRPNLPIIVQTAKAIIGDKEKAFEAGCDDYISKPINTDKLIVLINKYLKN